MRSYESYQKVTGENKVLINLIFLFLNIYKTTSGSSIRVLKDVLIHSSCTHGEDVNIIMFLGNACKGPELVISSQPQLTLNSPWKGLINTPTPTHLSERVSPVTAGALTAHSVALTAAVCRIASRKRYETNLEIQSIFWRM